ncbi:MAG: gamma-glutamyltransferase family protein [bacterium]
MSQSKSLAANLARLWTSYSKTRVFCTHVHFAIWLFVGLCLLSCQTGSENEEYAGIVSAASPEAAAAGVEILEAGGNAIDAAVAVSFTLAVTEPAMSGLGGQSQLIVFAPDKGAFVINGTSFSPAKLPTQVAQSDLVGHFATTVPSTVRVLHYAWLKYGSGKITWTQLLAPAIRFAREGFEVGAFRHLVFKRHAYNLRNNPATRTLFLHKDGSIPSEGEVFKQPVLANTLQRLAARGAEDFYTGAIARDIAADMKANGGWITLDDLQHVPQPIELPPLHTTYRGWDVYSLPPPGGGWVVLQMLNLLEQSSPEALAPDSPTRLIKLADALRIGHTNRQSDPVENLVDYQSDVREKISKEFAKRALINNEEKTSNGETTHFSVVDGSGIAVAVTASINAYFGARAAIPKLGFLYNSYMHEFELDEPGHPFALQPKAMPYSSMSPTILVKDGEARLILGSPGSSRIISSITQVVQLWVDAGMGIEEAVAARRVHVVPQNKLYIESQTVSDSVLSALEKAGYVLTQPRTDLAHGDLNPYFGGIHALAKENGRWRGAADPRRDGAVGIAQKKR